MIGRACMPASVPDKLRRAETRMTRPNGTLATAAAAPDDHAGAARRKALHRLQALSGALFAFFLGLHLGTTATASAGIAAYDRVLVTLRAVYRPHPLVEIALIATPAIVHVY